MWAVSSTVPLGLTDPHHAEALTLVFPSVKLKMNRNSFLWGTGVISPYFYLIENPNAHGRIRTCQLSIPASELYAVSSCAINEVSCKRFHTTLDDYEHGA